MTERLATVPIEGVPTWLREWNQTMDIQIGGAFQPGLTWADNGTGWLWVESAQSCWAPDNVATQALAEALRVDAIALGAGRVLAIRLPAQEYLVWLLQVLLAEQAPKLAPPLALLAKAARLALKLVQTEDIMAFAAPCETPWAAVIDSLLQFSTVDGQDWLPWNAHPQRFCAAWIPAWKQGDLRALRNLYMGLGEPLVEALALVESTPASGRRKSGRSHTPQSILDPWFCHAVDWWTRQVLAKPSVDSDESDKPKSPYHVPYRGEKNMLDVWSQALWSESLRVPFDADAWLVWRTQKQALVGSGWRVEWLQDWTGKAYYHLDLELQPPGPGATSAGDWTVVYYVAHNYWSTRAPLADWWRTTARQWQIGRDVLVKPDTWILPLLHQVASVFPPAEQGLTCPAPGECTLPSSQVFEFVTTTLPLLQALGCTCRLPELSAEELGNIRIRVQVRRVAGKARASQFNQRATGLFDAEQLVSFDWTVVVGEEEISRQQFEAMVEQNSPFVQLGGSWRLLPVQAILDQVRSLSGSRSGAVNLFQLSRAVLMSDTVDEQERSGVPVEVAYDEGDDDDFDIQRTLQTLGQVHQPELLPVPTAFQGSLRHYQHIGYSWLIHLRSIGCGGCLADDMGLGKTIQVIAYLLHVKELNLTSNPHLLLCPTSLLQNWKAELHRFAPSLRVYIHHGAARNDAVGDSAQAVLAQAARTHDLVITTYGTVMRDLTGFQEVPWDVLIADEAQNIKNHETKQAQAVRNLSAFHRIALTGTPVENRLEELWSIFHFVNPGYLGNLSWFRRVFAQPIAARPDAPAARQLHRLLRPVLLRRRKTEPEIQSELPEKWEVNDYAGLTAEQAALYQTILNRLFGQIAEMRALGQSGSMARRGHILSALVRLKQVCNHPCLLVGGAGDVGRSGKLKLLMDVLEDVVEDGEAALVFTQFRDMGELLCDVMERRFGHRPRFLHGGLSATARGQLVDAYQSGADPSPILVLSLKAGGVGLNLTRANHVFHFDRWWNPAVEDQATDRAFRIGQTRDVQVHKLICSGTLEERIDQLIHSKRAVSAAVVGESEGWVTDLDDEALKQLFALDVEASLEMDESV